MTDMTNPPPFIPVPAPAPRRTANQNLQVGLAVLVLGVLAVAVIVAFVSIINIVEIWFEYQYVPVAKAVLAVLVGALCLWVLSILMRRNAEHA